MIKKFLSPLAALVVALSTTSSSTGLLVAASLLGGRTAGIRARGSPWQKSNDTSNVVPAVYSQLETTDFDSLDIETISVQCLESEPEFTFFGLSIKEESWYGLERNGTGFATFVRSKSWGLLEGIVETSDYACTISSEDEDGSIVGKIVSLDDLAMFNDHALEDPKDAQDTTDELDAEGYNDEAEAKVDDDHDADGAMPKSGGGGITYIDILVAYTYQAMVGHHSNKCPFARAKMEIFIENQIFNLNAMLAVSGKNGANVQVNLVGTYLDPSYYPEEPPEDWGWDLVAIRARFMQNKRTQEMRQKYGADVVALIVEQPIPISGVTRGLAGSDVDRRSRGESPTKDFNQCIDPNGCPSEAFFVLGREPMEQTSLFAHEFGHIVGLLHGDCRKDKRRRYSCGWACWQWREPAPTMMCQWKKSQRGKRRTKFSEASVNVMHSYAPIVATFSERLDEDDAEMYRFNEETHYPEEPEEIPDASNCAAYVTMLLVTDRSQLNVQLFEYFKGLKIGTAIALVVVGVLFAFQKKKKHAIITKENDDKLSTMSGGGTLEIVQASLTSYVSISE